MESKEREYATIVGYFETELMQRQLDMQRLGYHVAGPLMRYGRKWSQLWFKYKTKEQTVPVTMNMFATQEWKEEQPPIKLEDTKFVGYADKEQPTPQDAS